MAAFFGLLRMSIPTGIFSGPSAIPACSRRALPWVGIREIYNMGEILDPHEDLQVGALFGGGQPPPRLSFVVKQYKETLKGGIANPPPAGGSTSGRASDECPIFRLGASKPRCELTATRCPPENVRYWHKVDDRIASIDVRLCIPDIGDSAYGPGTHRDRALYLECCTCHGVRERGSREW